MQGGTTPVHIGNTISKAPRFHPSTLYNTAERKGEAASGTPRAPPPFATGPEEEVPGTS
jgi:hypothetical protein